MQTRKISTILCTALLVLFSWRAIAQNASGSIVGHVKDPAGASVVAAQVTVTNLDIHDVRTVSTNGAGDYTVPVLQPGHYEVDVAAAGFKSEKTSGIVLDVDQTVRVETSLTVGTATESISVNAQALTLDTDTASVGEVIGSQQISELPLNGRNFEDLMLLAPGAVNNPGGEQTSYRISVSGTGISSVSVGGPAAPQRASRWTAHPSSISVTRIQCSLHPWTTLPSSICLPRATRPRMATA